MCACVGREAKHYFSNLAEYERLDRAAMDQLNASERKKVAQFAAKCWDGEITPGDPVPALIEACMAGGHNRAYCACLIAEAKKRFTRPSDFADPEHSDPEKSKAIFELCLPLR